jgi:hypothetical protein
VKIVSLGMGAGLLGHPVRSVAMLGATLGSTAKLNWHQRVDGLEIVVPKGLPSAIAVVFRVD